MPTADDHEAQLTVSVEIWSDIACPWCYLGKRRLETGIAAFEDAHDGAAVMVEYRSFELMPDLPLDFEGSSVDLLVRTKGLPAAQVRAMQEHVAGLAAEEGLDYDFGTQQPTNTRLAHQLVHLGKQRGVQLAMAERLFRAHFSEGRHVGRVAELADLAVDVGLDRSEVVEALEEGWFERAVEADLDRARSLGIHAVPFHVIDGRYAVAGAQPAEVFSDALRQVATERSDDPVRLFPVPGPPAP